MMLRNRQASKEAASARPRKAKEKKKRKKQGRRNRHRHPKKNLAWREAPLGKGRLRFKRIRGEKTPRPTGGSKKKCDSKGGRRDKELIEGKSGSSEKLVRGERGGLRRTTPYDRKKGKKKFR